MENRSLMQKPNKKEKAKASNYKLYPNPNSGTMTLEYTIEGSEMATLSIYDVAGRLVKEQILNAQSNKIIIVANELNNGVYYYVIKEGNSRVKAEKLVIMK